MHTGNTFLGRFNDKKVILLIILVPTRTPTFLFSLFAFTSKIEESKATVLRCVNLVEAREILEM